MNESHHDRHADGALSTAPGMTAALIVDVDGYAGPLDVLLMLARAQKVDLRKISILALVEQYLAFIAAAKRMELELAADYIVMASWLTYLKSRLLLPESEKEDEEPTGEELAARLAFQLQRLQSMRDVGARLMARDRLGLNVFKRGMPEGLRLIRKPSYQATIYDLLKAYADQRISVISHEDFHVKRAPVFAIEDARKRIERMFGKIREWSTLESLLPNGWVGTPEDAIASPEQKRRTAKASTFTASLELVKDGQMEIKQLTHFGPVYLRKRSAETP